jgi:hypothetical protein
VNFELQGFDDVEDVMWLAIKRAAFFVSWVLL